MKNRSVIIILALILAILTFACNNNLQACTIKCSGPDKTDTEVERCIKECMGIDTEEDASLNKNTVRFEQ